MNIFRSIRLRITLWYVLVLGFMLLAFSFVMLLLLSTTLNRRLENELLLRASHVADTVAVNGSLDGGRLAGFQLQPDEMVRVYNSAGAEVAAKGPEVRGGKIASLLPQTLNGASEYFSATASDGTNLRVLLMPVRAGEQVIGVIAFGRSSASEILNTVRNLALAATAVILLLAGVGGFFLTSRALRPVGVISRTAREIGGGDLGRRIKVSDGGEIGILAQTLNQTFERLQASFSRERRFTSDASHELRTPLAIIEAEATLALEKNRSADYYKKSLEVITQEAGHMSALINDMLFLARSDAGMEKPELKPLRLGDFIEELVSDISVLALAKQQTLKYTETENPIVNASETRLRQVFLNILENAIRYTKPGGTITVAVDRRNGQAVTEITDTGPGISPDALGHVFEPFFRGDEGRARTEGGTGLGLAIGQRIAEAHGGKVTVTSEPGKGSVFSVLLPLSAKDNSDLPASRKKPTRVFSRRKFRFWPFT